MGSWVSSKGLASLRRELCIKSWRFIVKCWESSTMTLKQYSPKDRERYIYLQPYTLSFTLDLSLHVHYNMHLADPLMSSKDPCREWISAKKHLHHDSQWCHWQNLSSAFLDAGKKAWYCLQWVTEMKHTCHKGQVITNYLVWTLDLRTGMQFQTSGCDDLFVDLRIC